MSKVASQWFSLPTARRARLRTTTLDHGEAKNPAPRFVACFTWIIAAGLLLGACSESPQIGPRQGTGYMISYEDSQALDYDVAWQSQVARTILGEATGVLPGEDYVFATEDRGNVISALTNRDGAPAWEEGVGDPLQRLLGIVRVGDELLASTQSDLFILDVATGRRKSQQRYGEKNVASTKPLVRGNVAIYGTPDGRIVYHNLGAGMMQAAYRIGESIEMAPIPAGPHAILVITRRGRINLVDPATNTRRWEAGILDTIEARPAIGENGLFVAGTDQSVWAFRLEDGRQMWRTRFQYPLHDDPVLLDNRTLYQAVPREGMAALNATTGEILWQNPEIEGGTVLTRKGNDLIVWDKDDRPNAYGSTFYRIDEATGDVLGRVEAKWIAYAASSDMERGEIFGLSRAGRLIKLVP